jgi:hypothetical protein
MKKIMAIPAYLVLLTSWCAGATLHVATTGSDTNAGTAAQPLASAGKALSLLKDKQEPCEIIIHAGVYSGCPGDGIQVGSEKTCGKGPLPSLLITAAKKTDGSYEEVWFDGAVKITKAEPVAGLSAVSAAAEETGKPGVYKLSGKFDLHSSNPQMWEADTRTRYGFAADLAAVKQFPATLWCDEAPRETLRSQSEAKEGIFVHTSDGRPPETHELYLGQNGHGFFVWWQNTTLRGLKFRNFRHGGVRLCASDSTLEDCYAVNCERGFLLVAADWTGVEAKNMRLVRCASDDCGGGVYIEGKHAIVEDCRFFKIRDKFMFPVNHQNDCGIHYYYPSSEGEVRRNLCVGFSEGIYVKCNSSVFVVENNTMVIGDTYPSFGFGWEGSKHPQSIWRYNISVGGVTPIHGADNIPQGMTVDYNCFWKNPEENTRQACFEMLRKAGAGTHDLVKDPRFANPAKGDYRLLPDSPCLKMGPKNETCGAYDAVGADFKDVQPPEVSLSLAAPAVPAGGAGELYFERDPWIGGGTNFIRRLAPENETDEWVTPNSRLSLKIEAEDFAGKPAQMKFKIGDGAWSAPEPYADTKQLDIPSDTVMAAVSVMVSDTAGNWSPPKKLIVHLQSRGPQLKSVPTVYANDHGVAVSFVTDIPCLASIEFGTDVKYGSVFEQPRDVQRRWSAEDGGEWVEIRSRPALTNCLVLLKPAVATGKTYHYRLTLQDEVGNKTATDDFTFTVKGAAKTYFISAGGEDTERHGTREKPWRTLQCAVDRALPGDRIILLPGLYPGETKLTHGGREGAPITIEAEKPETAVLDSGHLAISCLKLDKAPHVVVRGFEMRCFNHSSVYAVDSPHVTVEKSRIWLGCGRRLVDLGETHGTFAHRSPGFTADHNVIYEVASGIFLLQCPRSKITFNTVCGTDFGGAAFDFSAAGTVNRNNSFAYNGNDQYTIECADTNEMATFDSDYNNLGTKFRGDKLFEVKDKFFQYHGSKHVISAGKTYQSLKAWQDASGKDLHSIFIDPLYFDAAHNDYHLKADSPNIGAGEGGATIGALGVKEK